MEQEPQQEMMDEGEDAERDADSHGVELRPVLVIINVLNVDTMAARAKLALQPPYFHTRETLSALIVVCLRELRPV